MEDWQERVVVESAGLRVKLIALRVFIDQEGFFERPNRTVRLLQEQERHMTNYLHILCDRIDGFEI